MNDANCQYSRSSQCMIRRLTLWEGSWKLSREPRVLPVVVKPYFQLPGRPERKRPRSELLSAPFCVVFSGNLYFGPYNCHLTGVIISWKEIMYRLTMSIRQTEKSLTIALIEAGWCLVHRICFPL